MSYWEKAQKAMYIVGESFCHTYVRIVSHRARGGNVVQCSTMRYSAVCHVVECKKKEKRRNKGETKEKQGESQGISWISMLVSVWILTIASSAIHQRQEMNGCKYG
jgi:hypothetical protein